MTKVGYLTREMLYMVKKHKLFLLLPVFLMLIFIALFVYYGGAAVIISFIYAGI